MKKYILPHLKIFIVGLFLLCQAYLMFIQKHQTLEVRTSPNRQATEAILQENVIGQTFVAPKNNLSRIEVMLITGQRKNDQNVVFELWELEPEKKIVAQTTFNAVVVRNHLFHTIDFKPVRRSKNKPYYFLLKSPKSYPNNCLQAWMNEEDIYSQGCYFFNEQPAAGDLIFRVYSKNSISREFYRIVRNYSGIFAKKGVLLGVVILFFVVQIYFLFLILNFIEKSFRQKKN